MVVMHKHDLFDIEPYNARSNNWTVVLLYCTAIYEGLLIHLKG